MTEQDLEILRKKFFPRIPWTEEGPVRRLYRVKTAEEGGDPAAALAALAEREGFTGGEQETVMGDAATCLAAFDRKRTDNTVGMVFGTETEAFWSDISLGAPDEEGWRRMTVRSEEGENLTALAHAEGILRFRKIML